MRAKPIETLCITAVLVLAPQCVRPQGVPLTTDPVWSTGPANNTYDGAYADIDLDGDLDLVFGNYSMGNTAYHNEGGTFPVIPSWTSVPANRTTSIALGDIDGDGDPDLVCGNFGQGNTLYINEGGVFADSPLWTSGPENDTYSVALGDIDGDGNLDLICGNYNQPNTVYFNNGGTFPNDPAWSSTPRGNTTSIALGDVDNDGDVDLTCGNYNEANTLYLTSNDTLSWDPAWASDSTMSTWTIALGDVNGDGLLDLLCGNTGDFASAQSNHLYLNAGGLFSTTPVWASGPTLATNASALADIDHDGDLDAVFGNVDKGNYVYLNMGGTLSTTPDWQTAVENRTYEVIPGDFDGDGDLDLVCGNSGDWPSGESNTLYLNIREYLSALPTWSSTTANSTRSLALADIDGDGDLDLVCGNNGQGNTLYLNSGGSFSLTPDWTSTPANATFSIALGDIDGDGDSDLVCGNLDQGNTLYLNSGGSFSLTPDWTSTPANATWGIALGDLDGDGDLDLVCGNLDQANTLYLNSGGSFPLTPDWTSSVSNATRSVILGDIDGDGRLDLVCSNGGFGGQPNTVYFNGPAGLETDPSWSSGPANGTWCVTLGDVDGDGDLDLVCGNPDEHNTMYLNAGTAFPTSPAWSSVPTNATRSVLLGDIDFDGDLDLVCGNYNQEQTLYLNDRGAISTTPDRSWGTLTTTGSISAGDIDLDGDLDLACVNFDQSNTLHDGLRSPLYLGDPTEPANQLPNNDPYLCDVHVAETSENRYEIAVSVIDIDSDPTWIRFEYQYRGEWEYLTMDNVGTSGLVGPLSASPAGDRHLFAWDISLLPFDGREVVLRLSAIETPQHVTGTMHGASYQHGIGPVVPRRPEITALDTLLTFETVTVGDTVSRDLTVTNTGNTELSVTDISLPSSEMRLSAYPPFVIAPAGDTTLTVLLEPRSETSVSGALRIDSNDPITPTAAIPIGTDIRALEITSRLLSPEDSIPLGEAVTVIVTPMPEVRVEAGHLYHRPGGASDFPDSIPLAPSADDFIAVIPGSSVTEAGLEYYIKVENSGVFATDPPYAPADSLFDQPVKVPTAITAAAIPNSGSRYLAGRPVRVEVTLPGGAIFVDGTVSYRRGGETRYHTAGLVMEGPVPVASIPDSIVGPRGVEFWVGVNTMTRSLTDPPADPAGAPRTLQTTVQDLHEPASYPGSQYRMISVPLRFGEEFTGTLEALLAEQPEFGPYDPINWRCFRYQPGAGNYAELSDPQAASLFRPEPGRAFWLIARETNRITTAPVTGFSTPTDSTYELALAPGWNQVGNPFHFPVATDSLMVDTLGMADAAGTVIEPPVRWVVGGGYSYEVATLDPFEGYWVRNLTDSNVVLCVPPRESTPGNIEYVSSFRDDSPNAGAWMIRIRASCGDAVDHANFVGVHAEADNGWDRFDRAEPPMSPGTSISLHFPHAGWERCAGAYSVDIRSGYTPLGGIAAGIIPLETELWGHTWAFDAAISRRAGNPVREAALEFEGIETLPPDATVLLIDRRLEQSVDLCACTHYSFFTSTAHLVTDDEQARFVLLVGSEEFVERAGRELPGLPAATALYQNYPNPFNPSTVIRYDIARAGDVGIRIYDARGVLVRTLRRGHRRPGIYEEDWDGRNEAGRPCSSGIYFYRMTTSAGFEQTRKLVLLR